MRGPRTTLRLLALLALGLAAGACKQSDSILYILVAGPRSIVPVQLSVTVTAGSIGDTRNFLVPASLGEPIILPASFTIALDRSHMGPIIVSINAYDDTNSIVGYGMTAMQHIQIGGQTDITVMLMEGLPPDMPDGGVDGPVDSGLGGAGGGGGAGGSGGTGGAGGQDAAGQGGASGMDASIDGEDAMGLDSATD